jgi:hypothetical protein
VYLFWNDQAYHQGLGVKFELYSDENQTYDAFKKLSCFHDAWKFSPLNMTAGGKQVPSAHMLTMSVMFSLPPLHY